MRRRTFVITAAGGNGTAIQILERPLSRAKYISQGKQLLTKMEHLGAEQAGFLIPKITSKNILGHFEMAGGEFCGNGSRAAAIILSELWQKPKVSFTTSGFEGVVVAKVMKISEKSYIVEGIFPGLRAIQKNITLSGNQPATLVDFGGIIHVVIEAPFPLNYPEVHQAITQKLKLEKRSSVGVIWIERLEDVIKMHPVVWVRGVNSLFYEKSCGSGTIAVCIATGAKEVIQPTGKKIEAEITPKAVILRGEMEVVYRND
jgi:diaminopimelate epimerase